MSGERVATAAGWMVMLTAAVLAATLVHLITTDPLRVTALAAAGDIGAVLRTAGAYVLSWLL